MNGEWEPLADGLQQIIQLLRESQSTDNNIQRNVQKVLFIKKRLNLKERMRN